MDYVRTIINLNRSNTTWTLDPRSEGGRVFGAEGSPSGVGNQVSAEFNLAYRWHSCISEKDDQWTRDLYKQLFGKEAEEVELYELLRGLSEWEHKLPRDPHKRPFAGLQRNAEGKYNDDELVEIITESIEDIAGNFGPNNVPKCLKAITVLGIQQARTWNLGSLNEFRKFFGLKPHDTFEDICQEPEVADHLRNLYEHPEYVEMYPGLISEDAKAPMVPGAGITPTFTISRAILSDAVALVRGDRFYTIDYSPKTLTHWGYCEVQYDMAVQQGCVLYKLFLRAFPNHFKTNSIYAHAPMTIPSENRVIMKNLGRESHYSWDRPGRLASRIDLASYKAAKYVLEQQKIFNVDWQEPLIWLMGRSGGDYAFSATSPFQAVESYPSGWKQKVNDFYEHITLKLLHEKSCKIAGRPQVDITRDVGNLAHVHFAATLFGLPLKTADHPHGVYTEHELYAVLTILFVTIFADSDPVKSFPLRMAARAVTQQLAKIVQGNVKGVNGWLSSLTGGSMAEHTPINDYGVSIVKQLLESGLSAEEITWAQVLPTAGAIAANQSQVVSAPHAGKGRIFQKLTDISTQFSQVLDYYLSAGKSHLPEIQRLAKNPSPVADEQLLRYALEGVRLNGTFGAYRVAQGATVVDNVSIKPGDKVYCNFISANRDADRFPDPDVVRLDRPLDRYIHYGLGPHACLGGEAGKVGLTAMLRTVARLDGLRRAPGPQGQLKKVPRPGGYFAYMREDWGQYTPFPTTMKIMYDGPLSPLRKLT